MGIKLIALAAVVLSSTSNAAIISVDWKTAGDNLITRDTTSGLEWLDLTVTENRSYNDVSASFGAGQEFFDWRYATQADVAFFFNAFGGDDAFYTAGWTTQNNGLFDSVSTYWGDVSGGGSLFITEQNSFPSLFVPLGYIHDSSSNPESATKDYVNLNASSIPMRSAQQNVGSALVRVSTVPIPSAIWLFGSGLIGLISVARRKKV